MYECMYLLKGFVYLKIYLEEVYSNLILRFSTKAKNYDHGEKEDEDKDTIRITYKIMCSVC